MFCTGLDGTSSPDIPPIVGAFGAGVNADVKDNGADCIGIVIEVDIGVMVLDMGVMT